MLSFYKFALVISDRVLKAWEPSASPSLLIKLPDSRGIGWSKTSRREGERGRGRGRGGGGGEGEREGGRERGRGGGREGGGEEGERGGERAIGV